METETIKNTPALLFVGFIFVTFFGFWLRKRALSYDFKNRSKFLFLLDNIELVGGVLFGLFLLMGAIIF